MIVILHKNNKVVSVFDFHSKENIAVKKTNLVDTFFELSKQFKNTLIVWCENELKDYINEKEFNNIFHHKLIMASFNLMESNYIDEQIGYAESSPFIKINKEVKYPTWLMSSCIGGINSDILSSYDKKDYINRTFDYVLNSISKRGILNGLFCYSDPSLLLSDNAIALEAVKPSKYELFKFIKEHYKGRWTFIALFNSFVYQKRLLLLPFIASFFNSRKLSKPSFRNLKATTNRKISVSNNMDVIIPTIGRKPYLYDVLKDLSNQTLLPKRVIIVEQNPDIGSKTELDYLENQSWPFKVKHTFTNKTGACNARNIALKQIESDWVFMADDDIRFEKETLDIALNEMFSYGLNAATLSCLRQGEEKLKQPILQWNTFGSGCSIISKNIARQIVFDTAFEHGFGEDGDFGMQIRNLGEDIGHISKCTLTHLKAPIGGFRTKTVQPWQDDKIQPKPSPTIMLYNLKHQSNIQIKGYKTLLFIKFFKLQKNKNIVSYFFQMKKRWKKSLYLANKLKNELR